MISHDLDFTTADVISIYSLGSNVDPAECVFTYNDPKTTHRISFTEALGHSSSYNVGGIVLEIRA